MKTAEAAAQLFRENVRYFQLSKMTSLLQFIPVEELFHTALITNLDAEGTRLTTLAERAGMSKQSMEQLARELERRGYVSRKIDPTDKRAFLIRFTNRGRRLLADARSAKDELEAEYAALLGRK